VCNDCGETALGDKVDLAGKIAIASLSIPIATQVLELVLEIVNK
ncbi:MAG: stage III sporulation protein AD, partial [Clostridia bacterium]|nr:stage III sporulation protein AD [Clostridia bacterium]